MLFRSVLYIWKNATINLRIAPKGTTEIVNYLTIGTKVIVVDNEIKKYPFTVQEIKPRKNLNDTNDILNFKGYNIKGFWVKVQVSSGEIGYIFDGYLSKLKPDFELTEVYFDSNLKKIKTFNKKFLKDNSDNKYYRQRIYKNGSYIIEKGSNYDGHGHYFMPSIMLEEGYLLAVKTRPNMLEMHKTSGDATTIYKYDGNQLSFSTSLEAITIKKITYKGTKGIELIFEAWD